MLAFLEPLEELADYQEIVQKRGKTEGILQIAGCVSSQKTHLMYALGDGFEYRVIVFSSEEKAKQAYEEYKMLEENTFLYPAKDLLFYHADIKGAALTGKRMEVLKKLTEKKNREPVTVITTADAFLDGLPSKEKLWESRIEIEAGAVIDFQKLQEELVHLGYERESQIEGPGQFAVRGGILDVYPLTEEIPVRIELWGDEIDSIRSFDVESQRSVENMEQIVIYPATENVEKEEQAVSFSEYFPKEKSLFFFDEPVRLQETLEAVEKEYFHSLESRKNAGMTEEADEIRVFQTKEIIEKFNTRYGIGLTTLETRCGDFKVRDVYSIQAAGVNPYNNSFEMLTQDLKKLKRQGYRVILVSGSRTRAKRLAEDLRDYDLSSFYSEDMVRTVRPGEIMVVYGCVAEVHGEGGDDCFSLFQHDLLLHLGGGGVDVHIHSHRRQGSQGSGSHHQTGDGQGFEFVPFHGLYLLYVFAWVDSVYIGSINPLREQGDGAFRPHAVPLLRCRRSWTRRRPGSGY